MNVLYGSIGSWVLVMEFQARYTKLGEFFNKVNRLREKKCINFLKYNKIWWKVQNSQFFKSCFYYISTDLKVFYENIYCQHKSIKFCLTILTLHNRYCHNVRAILAIFQNGLGWLCLVSAALKNPSQELFFVLFSFGCRLIPRRTGRQN